MNRVLSAFLYVGLAVTLGGCGVRGSASDNFEKGKALLAKGERKEAYTFFKAAARKESTNPDFQWAAARTAPDQNAAYLHTRDAWQNGAKTRGVLLSLVRLSFHTEKSKKLAFALELYAQLPDSAQSEDFLADIYCAHDANDSCLAIRLRLFDREPTPELADKIAAAYRQAKQLDKSEAFLRACRAKKQLDGVGYVMLAGIVALEYDFKSVNDLFDEAKRYGLYTENVKLEHGGFLIAQGRLDEAEATIRDMATPAQGEKETLRNLHARLLLSLIYQNQNKPDSIEKLKYAKYGEEPWRKAEQEFYDIAVRRLNDTTTVLAELRDLRPKLPRDPVISLMYARECAREKAYTEAIKSYGELPPVMMRSPAIVSELAVVLAKAGKDGEALAVINLLHSKKLFTRTTLEVFRDLTYKKNLIDKSLAAQSLLEKRYSNDAGVKWSGGMLALRSGETNKALKIFGELAATYPNEPRFENARIATLMMAERYNEALAACDKSSAPVSVIGPLRARIYRRMGKNEQARSAYVAAMNAKPDASVMFEYADFLIAQGHNADAAAVYRDLSKLQSRGTAVDTAAQAMLQNNLAWSLMQQPGSDEKAVLDAARLAWELMPDNRDILDTYADALNHFGKYRECIKLLEGNQIVEKEPRLLYHLAEAYDKDGDINKAVRTYQQTLAGPAKDGELPMPVSKGQIEARIAELVAR